MDKHDFYMGTLCVLILVLTLVLGLYVLKWAFAPSQTYQQKYKETCNALNGKVVFDGRQYQCLK